MIDDFNQPLITVEPETTRHFSEGDTGVGLQIIDHDLRFNGRKLFNHTWAKISNPAFEVKNPAIVGQIAISHQF